MVPYFEKLRKEGEEGRKKITQFTRYGTVADRDRPVVRLRPFLENQGAAGVPSCRTRAGLPAVDDDHARPPGTIFVMWLGEQITERGIGNGISLIIFINIVGALPERLVATDSTACGPAR